MAGVLTHKEVVIPPPGPLIDGDDWLEEHVFHAPEIGSLLVGDPSQSDKANWVSPGDVANRVLVSQGPGQLPTYVDILDLINLLTPDGELLFNTGGAVDSDSALAWSKTDDILRLFGAGGGGGGEGLILIGRSTSPPDVLVPGSVTLFVEDFTGANEAGLAIWDGSGVAVYIGKNLDNGAGGGRGLRIEREARQFSIDMADGVPIFFNANESFMFQSFGSPDFKVDPGTMWLFNNLLIGGIDVALGDNAGHTLALFNGTAPTTSPGDMFQMWAQDLGAEAGSHALHWRDERGGVGSVGGDSAKTAYALTRGSISVSFGAAAAESFLNVSTNHPFSLYTNGVQRVVFDASGNMVLGTGLSPGTNAVRVFVHGAGVAPTTQPADLVQEWVEDIAGAGTAGKIFMGETGHKHRIGRLLSVAGGGSTAFVFVGGTVAASIAAQGTPSSTAETILLTLTAPANMAATNADKFNFHFSGTLAANANNKTVRLRINGVGGTLVVDSGTIGTNNADWILYGTAYRVSATNMRIDAMLIVGPAGAASGAVSVHRMNRDVVTVDFTAATTFDLTGQNGTANANDVQVTGGSLEYMPV